MRCDWRRLGLVVGCLGFLSASGCMDQSFSPDLSKSDQAQNFASSQAPANPTVADGGDLSPDSSVPDPAAPSDSDEPSDHSSNDDNKMDGNQSGNEKDPGNGSGGGDIPQLICDLDTQQCFDNGVPSDSGEENDGDLDSDDPVLDDPKAQRELCQRERGGHLVDEIREHANVKSLELGSSLANVHGRNLYRVNHDVESLEGLHGRMAFIGDEDHHKIGFVSDAKGFYLFKNLNIGRLGEHNRGKFVVIDGSIEKAVTNFRGRLLVCGGSIAAIQNARGKIVVVDGNVGSVKNFRGQLRVIGGRILGPVSDAKGKLRELP